MSVEVKRALCGFCSNHCRIDVKIEDGRFVGYDQADAGSSTADERWKRVIHGCSRRNAAIDWFYHPDRLNYALKRAGERGENKWQRISWDQALDEIAERLEAVKAVYGAEAIALSTTGEHNGSEEYTRRFQSLLGTPNFISHMQACFGVATSLSLAMSGALLLWPRVSSRTRSMLLIGVNPAVNMPYLWDSILDRQKQGDFKLIVIDPRRSEAASYADLWLQIRPGTNVALLLGMLNVIISEGLYDKEFVDNWCYGFERLAERVKEYPPERVAEITWIPADRVVEVARMFARHSPGVVFHGTGLETAHNSASSIQARLILPAITGCIEVRGGHHLDQPHSRLQSTAVTELRDAMPEGQWQKMIGAQEYPFSAWSTVERVSANVSRATDTPIATFGWAGSAHAPSVFRTMISGSPYPIKAMITEGQNPLLTFANTRLAYEAMKRLDLHVVMDVFMTPAAQMADYVLPAASFLEKPIIHGGAYYRRFNVGEAALPPQYDRRPEFDLWRGLGVRLGQGKYWPWETLDEAIDSRLAPMGQTLRTLIETQGGAEAERHQYGDYLERGFGTATGKFELASTVLEDLGYDPLPRYEEPPQSHISTPAIAEEYPLILTTGHRVRRYWMTEWRQIESVRRGAPDPMVQINPQRAEELGIADGDWVWVETPLGRVRLRAQHFPGIAPSVVYAEYGWWYPEEAGEEPSLHGVWRSNVNSILDDSNGFIDPISGAWDLKGHLCKVYKAVD